MIYQLYFKLLMECSVSFLYQLHHFSEGIPLLFHWPFSHSRALWSYVNSCLTYFGKKWWEPGEEESAAQSPWVCRMTGGWRPRGHSSTSEPRWSRFDSDGSGRPATWDNFGIWDNRLEEPPCCPPALSMASQFPKSACRTWAAHQ